MVGPGPKIRVEIDGSGDTHSVVVVIRIRLEGYLYYWSSRFRRAVTINLPRSVDWRCRGPTNDQEFAAIYCQLPAAAAVCAADEDAVSA